MSLSEGFAKFDLGNTGIDFVRERLEGNRSLARLILAIHNLGRGGAFTYLPRGTDATALTHNLQQSISGGRDLDPPVVATLQHWLAMDPDHVVVFEEVMWRADEIGRFTRFPADTSYWTYGLDVYYPLLHGDKDNATILRTLGAAQCTFGLGFLSSLPQNQEIPDSGEALSNQALHLIAEYTEQIIVEAFDGEGWILWARDPV